MPQELTIPFEIEIQNYNSISLNDSTTITDSEKIINTNPGENTEINYIQRPVLVYPQNNETDINENSVFTFGINNPQSVYKIELRELSTSFQSYGINSEIYTCSNSVTFGELLKYRFSSQNNNPNFLWRVIAYPGFTTVDDYLSFKTNETQDFNNYIGSEFRAFTAHPEAIH